MTSKESNGAEEALSENILRIADELVRQIDRAKKMVLAMILIVVVGVPLAWHAAPLFSKSPDYFMAIGYFTVLIAISFVIVGIWQWTVLSKWTERYKAYKELQKKIDAQLDFEGQDQRPE